MDSGASGDSVSASRRERTASPRPGSASVSSTGSDGARTELAGAPASVAARPIDTLSSRSRERLRRVDDAVPDLVRRLTTPEGDRYEMHGEVDRGGMGAILRVEDTKLRRELAMKVVLANESADSRVGDDEHRAAVRRFVTEAQVTSQLDHPGVVPVHDLGVDDAGHLYFTMKFVRGRTLESIIGGIRQGETSWPQSRVVQVLIRVCETLSFAHSRGVVHRDVKPANVMAGDFGEVYVMDWGLARVPPELAGFAAPASEPTGAIGGGVPGRIGPLVTHAGAVLGTPAYMPPEQALGKIAEVDARSDVYAVGAILYEYLTGHAPFTDSASAAQGGDVLVRAATLHPTPIAHLARGAVPELAAIAQKAMARSPSERYPTVVDLASDLRAFLEGRIVRAHRTGSVAETAKWISRNRALTAAASLAIAALAAGLLTNHQRLLETRHEADRAQRELTRFALRGAETALAADDAATAAARLAGIRSEHSGWEKRVLDARLHDSHLAPSLRWGVFDDRGRIVAGNSVRGSEVVRMDPASGRTSTLLRLPLDLGSMGASSDGAWIAVGPCGEIEGESGREPVTAVVSAATGRIAAEIQARSPVFMGFDTLRRRVCWARDGRVTLTSLADGSEVAAREIGVVHAVGDAMERPDGRRVIPVDAKGHATLLLDANTLEQVGSFDNHDEFTPWSGSAPRARHLFTGGSGDVVTAWDDAARSRSWTYSAPRTGDVVGLAVTHDGASLAAAFEDGSVRLLDPETGSRRLVLLGAVQDGGALRDFACSTSFSADGSWLITPRRDGLQVWDLHRHVDTRVLHGHASFVYDADVSPDGRRLVTAGWDAFVGRPGGLKFWDAASGALIAASGTADEIVESACWTRDGEAVLAGTYPRRGLGQHRIVKFDARTGERLAFPEVVSSQIVASRDRTMFACSLGNGGTAVIDAAGGVIASFPGVSYRASLNVGWAGDGRVAVADDSWAVSVFEVASGRRVFKVHDEKPCPVWGVVPDLNGRRFLIPSDDGFVHVHDAATGATLARLGGHGAGALTAAWSPDGSRIVTGGRNGLVLVWDAASYDEIVAFSGHASYVKDVAFSPDGARLFSAGGDGTVRLWSPEPRRTRMQALRLRDELLPDARRTARTLLDAHATPGAAAAAAAQALPAANAESREVLLQAVLEESLRR